METDRFFTFDQRLQIHIPDAPDPWDSYSRSEQAAILNEWENHRGSIPDRIKKIEQEIEIHQEMLYEEENFEASCELNDHICELASQINDLWIWYRTGVTVEA
ncbi:hypothetical protein [Thalassobacillus hwangdonensis]|uniref:Radical SAM protein n=1 Tax=Thalassobacillus hwangdonensis TaxID=546108 RepID=A0ABW3KZR5_9BACI